MARPRVLVVDDEETIRFTLHEHFASLGYDVEEAAGCAEAAQRFAAGRFDAAVLDYAMPDGNSVDLLPRLRAIDPDVPIVILTGHGTIELAVRAIQAGADQFLTKPLELHALGVVVERLVDKRRAGQRDQAGRRRESRQAPDPFLGESTAIRNLAEEARRVAGSTHRDLKHMVARKSFRSDLYFRVSTLPLRVPPLRERREDVPLLARRMLERIGREMARGELELEADAADALCRWSWPGNVRELRNVLERAVLLSDQLRIGLRQLRFDGPAPVEAGAVLDGTLADVERRAVLHALEECMGHVGRTAERLAISRSTLYGKLKAWGVAPGA